MSNEFTLTAETRELHGKGSSRRLRRLEGKVPAVLYGADKAPTSISLLANEVAKATDHEAFYSHVLTLVLDGNEEKVVVKDLQRHPAKGHVMHADFQRVDETHKLHMSVPLHFINEEQCVGVKMQGGKITHQMAEVEVQCLAKDLPEYLEIDMADVNTGTVLHLSDIALPEGVEIMALIQGDDHNLPIASVNSPKGAKGDDEEEASEE